MAKHEVSLKVDHAIQIGNVDLELPVRIDDSAFGRLKISRGGVDWLKSGARRKRYTLSWTELADLMEAHGHARG